MSGDGSVVPSAPWRLAGECVVVTVRAPADLRSLLPAGVTPAPGPSALVAASYQDSPVGPFLELSLGLPARIGLRPGWCVVLQIVSVPSARAAYRRNWGLPATTEMLSWRADGPDRVLRYERAGIEVRGEPRGPAFPAVVPVRSVQRRADGPVVVPRRLLALVRAARATVRAEGWADAAPPTDAGGAAVLAGLAGTHPGAVMSGMRVLSHPARHPAGLWSSFRAPLVVPDGLLAGPLPRRRQGTRRTSLQ